MRLRTSLILIITHPLNRTNHLQMPPRTMPRRRVKRRSSPAREVIITASSFPHIMDSIVSYAPYRALISLRATCRDLKDRADEVLMHHVVITAKGIKHPLGGLPAFYPDITANFTSRSQKLLAHVRVLDISCSQETVIAATNALIALIATSAKLDTIRFDCTKCPCSGGGCVQRWPGGSSPRLVSILSCARYCSPCGNPYLNARGVSRLVTHIPYASDDTLASGRMFAFASVTEYVVIYRKQTPGRPEMLQPVLREYCEEMHRTRKFGVGLTIVDLPIGDRIFEWDGENEIPTRNRDIATRRAHAIGYLWNKLISLQHQNPITEAEMNAIIGNVQFVTRAEYRRSMPREAYRLETALRARDCVE